jgi:hypothetical protein
VIRDRTVNCTRAPDASTNREAAIDPLTERRLIRGFHPDQAAFFPPALAGFGAPST